ncbi:uncharacterized protein LOC110068616 [Orbicella faveolata]|uniref:uncharacterized protein LOC110068616 n=1 Tax=Orbicella faveolata TaxID=48498 RepID=UPI0009E584DF|nr:uncharacterized protein LOC110068616 [Orbicella faveolata]
MSQERDELRSEAKSFENQLNAVAVEKAALYKDFQSVMDQLSELKENLQVEQKEKEELNHRLDDVTQEKSNLLSKVSSLDESISSADQDRKILEDKMNALTEGKDEVEKKLASVTKSLETEKQVCRVRNLSVGSLTLGMKSMWSFSF